MDECLFECGLLDQPLTSAGKDRAKNIIDSSKLRGDGMNIELQRQFEEDVCHRIEEDVLVIVSSQLCIFLHIPILH